ncbi:unnamed protein product [Kluyveromyces dobzhanskii CBS 2104]|uniref:WGS project CCBQ000000000 data, contig 00099 n=1 Tax=Kluyveromyces dobzhanskii CBS 2104 TaxID=1427455 RepID=A0A0A8L442_9SACH|nr:unnamed protein product [Kluyveromyces dobzhanskii CBS 2104]
MDSKEVDAISKNPTICSVKSSCDSSDDDFNKISVPDGGYGWVVVFSSFIFNLCTWGAASGYSVYLSYYMSSDEYETGSDLDYAAIGGLSFGVGLFLAPLFNYLLIKTSTKKVLLLGIVVQNVSVLLAAFATKLWQVYLTQGVAISFGLGAICFPNTTIVAPWFRKRRSLALGISAGGSGLGGIIFNLSMQKIIDGKNVRWALISQCIISSVLSTIALILVKTRKEEVEKHSDETSKVVAWEMFKYPVVWLLIGWVCFTMLGYVIQLYSLFSFTVSLGYSSKQGSIVSSMICLGAFLGRPTVGLISDIFGPVTTAMFCHLLVGILCYAMWIPCRSYATIICFALFEGMMMGTIWPLLTSIITRLVGLRKLESVYSVIWMFIGACSIVSPVIGLRLKRDDVKKGENAYLYTAIYAGAAYLCAALSLCLMRGFLVARDQISMRERTGYDDGELQFQPEVKDALRGTLTWKNLYRKI